MPSGFPPLVAVVAVALLLPVLDVCQASGVVVRIISAAVPDEDGTSNGESDPYITVELGEFQEKSPTVSDDNTPYFGWETSIGSHDVHPDAVLRLVLADKDLFGTDALGTANMVVSPSRQQRLCLEAPAGHSNGDCRFFVNVKVTYTPFVRTCAAGQLFNPDRGCVASCSVGYRRRDANTCERCADFTNYNCRSCPGAAGVCTSCWNELLLHEGRCQSRCPTSIPKPGKGSAPPFDEDYISRWTVAGGDLIFNSHPSVDKLATANRRCVQTVVPDTVGPTTVLSLSPPAQFIGDDRAVLMVNFVDEDTRTILGFSIEDVKVEGAGPDCCEPATVDSVLPILRPVDLAFYLHIRLPTDGVYNISVGRGAATDFAGNDNYPGHLVVTRDTAPPNYAVNHTQLTDPFGQLSDVVHLRFSDTLSRVSRTTGSLERPLVYLAAGGTGQPLNATVARVTVEWASSSDVGDEDGFSASIDCTVKVVFPGANERAVYQVYVADGAVVDEAGNANRQIVSPVYNIPRPPGNEDVVCPEDTYRDLNGTSYECRRCPAQAGSPEGSLSRKDCECQSGYFDEGEGDDVVCRECTNCAAGHYRTADGMCGGKQDYVCSPCPANAISQSGSVGVDACFCLQDHYDKARLGGVACASCPGNSSSVIGSVDVRHCVCDAGFFDAARDTGPSGPMVDCRACQVCAANHYRVPGSVCGLAEVEGGKVTGAQTDFACTPCPALATSKPGARNGRDCECSAGYFDASAPDDLVPRCEACGRCNDGEVEIAACGGMTDVRCGLAQGSGGPEAAGSSAVYIGTSAAAGAIVLVVLVALAIWRHRAIQRRNRPLSFDEALAHIKKLGLLAGGEGSHDDSAGPREIRRGNITVLEKIGEGAFGEVSKGFLDEEATRNVPGFTVALKVIKDSSEAAINEFVGESALMANLRHRNVISLIGVVTRGHPKMMVVPFCGNGDLKGFLQRMGSALSLKVKLAVCRDVADGMAYLSSRSLVHRDLAARNVLISDDFTCKVSDFGMSRQLEASEDEYRSLKSVAVPVRWSAVEALEERRYTEKSDVWAFGVLCYEVFTDGATPYSDMNNNLVLIRVKGGYRLPCPEGCPKAAHHKFMSNCWAAMPEDRPTFQSLAEQIAEVAGSRKAFRSLVDSHRKTHPDYEFGTAGDAKGPNALDEGHAESTSGEAPAHPNDSNVYADLMGASDQIIKAEDDVQAGRRHFNWSAVASRALGMESTSIAPMPEPKLLSLVRMAQQPPRETGVSAYDQFQEATALPCVDFLAVDSHSV